MNKVKSKKEKVEQWQNETPQGFVVTRTADFALQIVKLYVSLP